MDWDKERIALLESAVSSRWIAFCKELKTDRKNLSELWNFHIKKFGISVVRPIPRRQNGREILNVQDFVDAINLRNPEVSDALCVRNPDRAGQYLFIPREKAATILAIGLP